MALDCYDRELLKINLQSINHIHDFMVTLWHYLKLLLVPFDFHYLHLLAIEICYQFLSSYTPYNFFDLRATYVQFNTHVMETSARDIIFVEFVH